jgi:hypothetical protein
MKCLSIASGVCLVMFCLGNQQLHGGQVGMDDFGAGKIVEDFNVQPYTFRVASPLTINGVSYASDDKVSIMSLGPSIGRSGQAMANSTSVGYLELTFSMPVDRAGAFLGGASNWTIRAEFFDVNDQLIAWFEDSGVKDTSTFMGWQAPHTRPIQRIRYTDLVDDRITLIMDDVAYEIVLMPEPATAGLLLIVTVLLLPGRLRRTCA